MKHPDAIFGEEGVHGTTILIIAAGPGNRQGSRDAQQRDQKKDKCRKIHIETDRYPAQIETELRNCPNIRTLTTLDRLSPLL